jgi:hypothetical protein
MIPASHGPEQLGFRLGSFNILLYKSYLDRRAGQALPELVVIGIGDVEETHAPRPQVLDRLDDVKGPDTHEKVLLAS